MKKGLSILLLFVFLFNVGGYYFVIIGVHLRLDRQLTQRLDENLYRAEETIAFKIPIALPYPIHADGFERVDGRFEHDGEYYKLIKHKLQNDTLYVVCIRDHGTRELVTTMIRYVHSTLGVLNTGTDQKAVNFISKLIKDFFPQDELELIHQNGFVNLVSFSEELESFLQPVIPVHAPPPRAI